MNGENGRATDMNRIDNDGKVVEPPTQDDVKTAIKGQSQEQKAYWEGRTSYTGTPPENNFSCKRIILEEALAMHYYLMKCFCNYREKDILTKLVLSVGRIFRFS